MKIGEMGIIVEVDESKELAAESTTEEDARMATGFLE